MQQLSGSDQHSTIAPSLCFGDLFKGLGSLNVHPTFSSENTSALKNMSLLCDLNNIRGSLTSYINEDKMTNVLPKWTLN